MKPKGFKKTKAGFITNTSLGEEVPASQYKDKFI
jgi:hypothetical protein